jgi:hypothetical protein
MQIQPDNAEYHWALSYPLLLLGNFEEGWKEYDSTFANITNRKAELIDNE